MSLRIIATGGTFDKHYNELNGTLGFATAAAQTLAPGVYVAMNGQVFSWDNVTKNRSAGVFQAL